MKKLTSLLFLIVTLISQNAFAQAGAKTYLLKHKVGAFCVDDGYKCTLGAQIAPTLQVPEADEVLGKISISLDANTIRITNTGQKNAVTGVTLAKYSAKKVSPTENEFPADLAESLFKSVDLPTPSKIVFKPSEQTYNVSNRNISFTDRTKITFGGKEYTLVIVTTTGAVSSAR